LSIPSAIDVERDTTPLVLMPMIGTVNPIRPANAPPLMIGRPTGNLVASLNSVGEMMSTGR